MTGGPLRQRRSAAAPGAALAALLALFAASANTLPAPLDPFHTHVVIGGSDEQQAHALARHLAAMRLHPEVAERTVWGAHAARAWHRDGACLDEADDDARVLSIGAGDPLSIAALSGGDPPAAGAALVIPPPSATRGAPQAAPAAAPDAPLPAPDPPPRAS